MNNNYTPKPIDCDHIEIPKELDDLVETLAENAHDLWAQTRAKDGWTYGAKRDDAKKEHPCLVAYDQLPESEKEYDRVAVLGTIKAILSSGYAIQKI